MDRPDVVLAKRVPIHDRLQKKLHRHDRNAFLDRETNEPLVSHQNAVLVVTSEQGFVRTAGNDHGRAAVVNDAANGRSPAICSSER